MMVAVGAVLCFALPEAGAGAQTPSVVPGRLVVQLAPITLGDSRQGMPSLPPEQALGDMDGTIRDFQHAVAKVLKEVSRTEVDVQSNPYWAGDPGYMWPYWMEDPTAMDPLMAYGFDYSYDESPVWTHNTGKLLPPRKDKLEEYMSLINADMQKLQSQAGSVAFPAGESPDMAAQWDVLTDTVHRIQQHCSWLQNLTQNNTDDNTLIARAAIKIHDDLSGVDEIRKRLSRMLEKSSP